MIGRALLASLLAAVAAAAAAAVAAVLDGSAVMVFTASLVVGVGGVVLSSAHLARLQRLLAETLALRERNEALRERKLLAEGALDGLEAAVVVAGRGGRVELGNSEARKLLRGGAKIDGKALQNLIDGAPAAVRAAFKDPAIPGFEAAFGDHDEVPWTLARRPVRGPDGPGFLYVAAPLGRAGRRREARARREAARDVAEALADTLGELPLTEATAERLATALAPYRRASPTPREAEWHPFLEELRSHTPFALPAPAPASPGWFDPDRLGEALHGVLSAAEADGREVEVAEANGGFEVTVRGLGVAEDAVLREVVEEHGGDVDEVVGEGDGRGELRIRLPAP